MYRVLELNPQLMPFAGDIDYRMHCYHQTKDRLLADGKSLLDFANAFDYYGIHSVEGGWIYREWAPAADHVFLTGEFNKWDWTTHPLKKLEAGNWEIFIPEKDGLKAGSKVKTIVENNGISTEHIPLYANYVIQDPKTLLWSAEVTDTQKVYPWHDQNFKAEEDLLIYEAHVGMAQEEGRVGTYREFADLVLPRIKKDGYTTIQLMAIMEHPYYGSFGYQVSNFYAASSRFGCPDDLKYLVDTAHQMGIQVLLDVIHSHAVKNTAEGINRFDGTSWQFFHDGDKGEHPTWGTKCFNYGKDEVIHFLLSNLKYWMTEYHFDGFRFDGVTSMLYHDHGMGTAFDDNSKYFSLNTDTEAITYLQLANELIRQVNPSALTIAEDMSGMPGMALPIDAGGIGFDYRLGMGLPDMWIRTIKERSDEQWDIQGMWGDMCLRRPGENTVAYVESHDQALVGDKTMIFRLADANMYTDMEKSTHNLTIDRAIALHKMIRLFTLAGGGEAYLNFMGNEFGHPEWIDFPREGNGWDYKYCRRQWSLVDNGLLKYEWLGDFDKDMIWMTREYHLFRQHMADLLMVHGQDKLISFSRAGLIFAFNFHPTNSRQSVKIAVPKKGTYKIILCTDDGIYGGNDLVQHIAYPTQDSNIFNILELYLPARTAVVLAQIDDVEEEAVEKTVDADKAAEEAAEEKKPEKNEKAAAAIAV